MTRRPPKRRLSVFVRKRVGTMTDGPSRPVFRVYSAPELSKSIKPKTTPVTISKSVDIKERRVFYRGAGCARA